VIHVLLYFIKSSTIDNHHHMNSAIEIIHMMHVSDKL
jgi:hypothetical protein